MNVPISVFENKGLPEADIIVDALLGYGLQGEPREPIAGMFREVNESNGNIISLDVPTGLNTSTAEIMDACIRASYTMTLPYPKISMSENPEYVGKLYIADIGIPRKLYKEMGLESPEFFM